MKVLGIPSLDFFFFLIFFPFLCFLCLKPRKKNNDRPPKLTATSQQKAPKLPSPAEAHMLGVALSLPRVDPLPRAGKCGHACARASRNLPQFLEAQGAKGREAGARDTRAGFSFCVFLLTWALPGSPVSPVSLPCCRLDRGVASQECLPRVCWNVVPGSYREKQALLALGLLLATLRKG